MYIENKGHALAIMKYANMRGNNLDLKKALIPAIVGRYKNGCCKIDNDAFWNKVLLKDVNCIRFLEYHRISDLEELYVRHIEWTIDIKLKEKNWLNNDQLDLDDEDEYLIIC